MAKEALIFRGVTKKFGHFKALDNLSFSIQAGELYGLIGPNGAGKTTAIKILMNLLKPNGGEVQVLGKPFDDLAIRQKLGFMPQELSLYVDLTVRENLEFFGGLYGISKNEIQNRILELLDFVDLTDWANELVSNLSGGMKHRASLAAALLSKPKLLVLDEPTVGVDPELRNAFWKRFRTMQDEGTTILLTTHYMDEAARCQRVGLINHGQMIAEGPPRELMEQSKTDNLEDAFLALARRSNK